VLVLSEPPAGSMTEALQAGLTPTIYTPRGLEAVLKAARAGAWPARGAVRMPVPVHVKVDTGMHRVGAAPDEARELALRVAGAPELELAGLWTHLAMADSDPEFTAGQLSRFDAVSGDLAARGIRPGMLHAANSAGALYTPESRYDMVRCGIAVYGYAPVPSPGPDGFASAAQHVDLRPVMALRARVTHVQRLRRGEGLSYGLRYRVQDDAVVATVPLGYADGVARALWQGGEVVIGGERRPIAGVINMDQLMVDCGADADVRVGDEVTLIGAQGEACVTADDWAGVIGTISWEVLCSIGPRVPRHYLPGPASGAAAGQAHTNAEQAGTQVEQAPQAQHTKAGGPPPTISG
jgi:alanine racemase